MSHNWYPVIHDETCADCGQCIDFCCNGVYGFQEKKVKVLHPENCEDGCKGCEPICPTESITHTGEAKPNSSTKCSCNCNGGCCG